MKNFAYQTNYPFGGFNECTRSWCPDSQKPNIDNDDRFGGFILPFITGAVVSAPFWFIAGNNKQQQYAQQYYQNQPYPMYYPYPVGNSGYPSYFPYPPYR